VRRKDDFLAGFDLGAIVQQVIDGDCCPSCYSYCVHYLIPPLE
jgi:hypothetical protein